jgi:hypothetical protein
MALPQRLPDLRRALALRLLGPPPLLWRLDGWRPVVLWRAPEAEQWPRSLRSWLALAALVPQQLHWWTLRPLRQAWRRRALRAPGSPPQEPLPRRLALAACWLNSFRPQEVRQWQALGVSSWEQLSSKLPESQVGGVHSQRRQHWPLRCRPALRLLSDKAALLERCDPRWRSPWLCLPLASPSPEAPAPSWWQPALEGPGLVIKPLAGHACRGVVRYRIRDGQLHSEPLFRTARAQPTPPPPAAACSPAQLHRHWQALQGHPEAALAMPYLLQAPSLPATEPAVVVRVITRMASPGAAVAMEEAWLELPLPAAPSDRPGGCGPVALLNLQGQLLPLLGPPLNAAQAEALATWQALVASRPPELLACLEASLALHQALPPIDAVAWDWIPAAPQPLLLEGNGGFGLLVPQLWQELAWRSEPRAPGGGSAGSTMSAS